MKSAVKKQRYGKIQKLDFKFEFYTLKTVITVQIIYEICHIYIYLYEKVF